LWLENLADDVTLEAAAMDGTARGAEDVRRRGINNLGPTAGSGRGAIPTRVLKRLRRSAVQRQSHCHVAKSRRELEV
jgi:hypothetical protein